MVGQTMKVFLLETLNFYKFIFLLPSCPYTSAVSFGSEGSLFNFYSLHPQTHPFQLGFTLKTSVNMHLFGETLLCIVREGKSIFSFGRDLGFINLPFLNYTRFILVKEKLFYVPTSTYNCHLSCTFNGELKTQTR